MSREYVLTEHLKTRLESRNVKLVCKGCGEEIAMGERLVCKSTGRARVFYHKSCWEKLFR